MTTKPAATKPTPEKDNTPEDAVYKNTAPQAEPGDPRIAAQQRAQECGAEIKLVLDKYHCDIRVFLRPLEAIGNDGGKAMVSAVYGIIPLES